MVVLSALSCVALRTAALVVVSAAISVVLRPDMAVVERPESGVAVSEEMMEVIRGYSASTRAVLPVIRKKLVASIDVCLEPDEASRPVPRYGTQRRSRPMPDNKPFAGSLTANAIRPTLWIRHRRTVPGPSEVPAGRIASEASRAGYGQIIRPIQRECSAVLLR